MSALSGLNFGLGIVANNLTGFPSRAGKFTFKLQVTDSEGQSTSKKFRITVRRALLIFTRRLEVGKVGQSYSARLIAIRGKKPYVWSLFSGTLPQGLVLDPNTGEITGIPLSAGSSDIIFAADDVLGGSEVKLLTLTINP